MPFSSDTTPEARRVLIDIIRRQSPERRIEIAVAATEATREMIRADLLARYPDAGSEELHARFLERWLGPVLAKQVLAHRATHARVTSEGV